MVPVELSGVNFVNHGAHLMAVAARDRLLPVGFVPAISVFAGSFAYRRDRGFAHFVSVRGASSGYVGKLLNGVVGHVPSIIKKATRSFSREDCAALIDASGFAFSDQWPSRLTEAMARHVAVYARAGKPVVFLPQAFGPFQRRETRVAMTEIIEMSTRIYARDEVSFDFLRELAPGANSVRRSPDFTIGLNARSAVSAGRRPIVGLLPNYRMLGGSPLSADNRYVSTLVEAAEIALGGGYEVHAVAHEHGDVKLVELISSLLGERCSIFRSEDPLEVKRYIGEMQFVIGSRFHGVIAALSQAVPAIVLGWSHKYQMLCDDFEVGPLYVDFESRPQDVLNLTRRFLDPVELVVYTDALLRVRSRLLDANNLMWDDVLKVISGEVKFAA